MVVHIKKDDKEDFSYFNTLHIQKKHFIANDSLILNGGCLRKKMFISMHIK